MSARPRLSVDVPCEGTPGPWLRLASIGGAFATALAVSSGALHLGLAHRLLVVTSLPPLVALALAGRLAYPRLLRPAVLALALVVVSSALGGVVALGGRPGWAVGLHLGVSAAAFAAALLTAAACYRGEPVARAGWRDYVTLTKPRIMSLLLLTAAAGMFAGARGVPDLAKLAALLVGGALASGGASALNHLMDRDLDALMGERTAARPVAAGRVTPPRALEFGLVLSALSFVLLASVINVLTALLALTGTLGYVLVYTGWLKRSTPQNIVIGGAAGAIPPLVGWAAATGDLTLPAIFLFLIVFFWTPPHFWALALLIKRDYAAAGIPMLPVVRGDRETARQILLYSLVLSGVTALPFIWHAAGGFYLGAAILLDACLIGLALGLRRQLTRARAGRLFHFSLLYLALLFVALAIDPFV
ncbi:MAG TPA: heme o synthase [Thermoleophilaceae bacterium]